MSIFLPILGLLAYLPQCSGLDGGRSLSADFDCFPILFKNIYFLYYVLLESGEGEGRGKGRERNIDGFAG